MRETEQSWIAHRARQFAIAVAITIAITIAMAIGPIALADPDETAAPPAPAQMSGVQVYNAVCVACHAPPGIGGAPALGDSNAWATRVAQGTDTLNDHALQGFSGSTGIMPRKGGRLDLSDEEIVSAVRFMIEQAAASD